MTTASQAINDLLRLQAAYEKILAGKAWNSEFTQIVEEIDWDNQPPELFTEAIHMAITLEMPRFAYQLAQRGLQVYPKLLQQAEYVLAPSRILKTGLPPVPGLNKAMNWLNDHAHEYKGMWVAILNGELFKTASSHSELMESLGDTTQNPEILVARVP